MINSKTIRQTVASIATVTFASTLSAVHTATLDVWGTIDTANDASDIIPDSTLHSGSSFSGRIVVDLDTPGVPYFFTFNSLYEGASDWNWTFGTIEYSDDSRRVGVYNYDADQVYFSNQGASGSNALTNVPNGVEHTELYVSFGTAGILFPNVITQDQPALETVFQTSVLDQLTNRWLRLSFEDGNLNRATFLATIDSYNLSTHQVSDEGTTLSMLFLAFSVFGIKRLVRRKKRHHLSA